MEETQSGAKHSRKQWLIEPQYQLRFAFYFIGGGITLQMLLCLYLLYSLEATLQKILNESQMPEDITITLLDKVGTVELNITVISMFLMVIAVILGVRTTHRIYGPIVQVRKHVAALMSGDFSSRIHLRDRDHFTELSEDLNQLAEVLAKRP
ncbi:MAG: hypothetical protein AB7F86_18100 [Bdellovibrionales bacterium]